MLRIGKIKSQIAGWYEFDTGAQAHTTNEKWRLTDLKPGRNITGLNGTTIPSECEGTMTNEIWGERYKNRTDSRTTNEIPVLGRQSIIHKQMYPTGNLYTSKLTWKTNIKSRPKQLESGDARLEISRIVKNKRTCNKRSNYWESRKLKDWTQPASIRVIISPSY